MSRNARRAQLAPAYILHHQPYRDTSRILEAFTREHGRLTLFARGVRGPKGKLGPLLQPFRLLLLNWSGRGEAPQLTGAEAAPSSGVLPARCLMGCFYLNELLLKLTTRHDPHAGLFDVYHEALEGLRTGVRLEPTLRIFEKRLLQEIGYGLELTTEADTGHGIEPQARYQLRPAQGLVRASPGAAGSVAGRSVLALAAEELHGPEELDDARRLLTAAVAHCLEGRELATRAVARAMARNSSSEHSRERR
jgi:DNA repair protein RecO (recombination protein O)